MWMLGFLRYIGMRKLPVYYADASCWMMTLKERESFHLGLPIRDARMAQINLLSTCIAAFHLAVGISPVFWKVCYKNIYDGQLDLIVRTGAACA